ncbi:MAG TPA: type II toxin-antitoxin system PemK/MazF family toxin [Kofleriaceae bacterium]
MGRYLDIAGLEEGSLVMFDLRRETSWQDRIWVRDMGVQFPAPVGKRPVVLVSRDEAYAIKARVTVVAVTRTVRGIPTEVRVGPSEGLPKVGVANADELVTIPRTTLRERIATLSRAKLDEIDAALRFALGLKA